MSKYWLSYSGYKTYKDCPKKYRLTRVDKEDPPEPQSKHHTVLGSVVQRVYEDFYNKEIWRRPSNVSDRLLDLTEKHSDDYLEEEYVDFSHPTCNFDQYKLLDDCKDTVEKTLDGIKDEQLLGPYAKSEIELKAHFQQNYFLYGKVDFIIRKKDDQILLVDGKSSKHRDKYADLDQLYFYALCFKLVKGVFPDKLGFFFYRFADQEDEAFDWYDLDPVKLKELKNDLLKTFTFVQQRRYNASPEHQVCTWCPFEDVCKERQNQLGKKREKRRWKRAEKGEETLPDPNEGDVMIGFGNDIKQD